MSLLSFFTGRSRTTFKYLHPLNPELHREILIGRRSTVEAAVDDLLDNTPICISAPRLSGKTTMLFLVAAELRQRASEWSPLFVDLQGIEPDSTAGVAREILLMLREYAKGIEGGSQLSIPEESDLQVVFEAVLGGDFGRIVLLLDGVDAIDTETTVSAVKLLKAAISRTVLKLVCPFVLTGALDLALRGQSNALNVARTIYLEDFSATEVSELLQRVSRNAFFEDAAAAVHRLSGGHPRLVQHLAALAYARMNKEERKSVDRHDVEQAAKRLIEQNDHLFATTLELLERHGVTREFLDKVQSEDVPFTRLRADVLTAEQVGIIRGEAGVCRLRNPLFADLLNVVGPRQPKPAPKEPTAPHKPAAPKEPTP